jgi:hypothetical protein
VTTARGGSFQTAALLLVLSACGGGSGSPTPPSSPQSFLTGTWRGSLTIQQDPTAPQPPAPTTGAVVWTFEVVPQTNAQTFRATVQSSNAWLPITLSGSTVITPSSSPPAQISTLGDYMSPRGCRGSFGSSGTAAASRIEADFTGVDCNATFTGRVVLTKD